MVAHCDNPTGGIFNAHAHNYTTMNLDPTNAKLLKQHMEDSCLVVQDISLRLSQRNDQFVKVHVSTSAKKSQSILTFFFYHLKDSQTVLPITRDTLFITLIVFSLSDTQYSSWPHSSVVRILQNLPSLLAMQLGISPSLMKSVPCGLISKSIKV
jgi:hypothetical protein